MNGDENHKMSEKEARKAIIGTWERIAWGMYLDDIREVGPGESYVQYFTNGKSEFYFPKGYGGQEFPDATLRGLPGYTIQLQYHYSIIEDILIEKRVDVPNSKEECYKYRFFENGNKLELIDADWTPIADPKYDIVQGILLIRIQIFKKK